MPESEKEIANAKLIADLRMIQKALEVQGGPPPVHDLVKKAADRIIELEDAIKDFAKTLKGILVESGGFFEEIQTETLRNGLGEKIGEVVTTPLFDPEPEQEFVANQWEVDRHAQKQDCSYADAWRYFERNGYDMSGVTGQYDG